MMNNKPYDSPAPSPEGPLDLQKQALRQIIINRQADCGPCDRIYCADAPFGKKCTECIAQLVLDKISNDDAATGASGEAATKYTDTKRLTFVLEHLAIYDEYGMGKQSGMDDTKRIYDTRGSIDSAIEQWEAHNAK